MCVHAIYTTCIWIFKLNLRGRAIYGLVWVLGEGKGSTLFSNRSNINYYCYYYFQTNSLLHLECNFEYIIMYEPTSQDIERMIERKNTAIRLLTRASFSRLLEKAEHIFRYCNSFVIWLIWTWEKSEQKQLCVSALHMKMMYIGISLESKCQWTS